MNHFRRLTSALLALAMVLSILSTMGTVTAQANTQYEWVPEDARMEELLNMSFKGTDTEDGKAYPDGRFDSVPKGIGLKESAIDTQASTEPAVYEVDSISVQVDPEELLAITRKGTSEEAIQALTDGTAEYTAVAVNPLFKDFISEEDIPLPSKKNSQDGIAPAADPVYLDGEVEAALALREAMVDRTAAPVIYYETTYLPETDEDFADLMNAMLNYATDHTGVPNEGDYLYFHWVSYSVSLSGYVDDDGATYYLELSWELVYNSTASQEAEVDRRMDSLEIPSASAYDKISAIYEAICSNVTYKSGEVDADSAMHSAYAALVNVQATSQGIANLFHRFAMESGIEARIVAGELNSKSHVWNIVKLGDTYYNVDAALDAGNTNYQYFLKGSGSFSDHERWGRWDTDDFHESYPMATKDYAVPGTTNVAINSTNFPDANFRSIVKDADLDGNGTLSQAELENVVTLDIQESSISDLTGIAYFTEITYLNCCTNNLTSLDVSQNTKLVALDCYENKLGSLDVSKNTELIWIGCSHNKLSSLNVSKNTKLENLYCANNQIKSLDASNHTALVELDCENNALTSLDVTGCTALEVLNCYNDYDSEAQAYLGTNNLSTLDIGDCTSLYLLRCQNVGLKTLDLSNNKYLEALYCHNNELGSLDVSKNTLLEYLSCQRNNLKKLDVTKNTALIRLFTYDNPLENGLDISKNTALEELSCSKNGLTKLNISKHTSLKQLYCYSNQLTSLDVSKNTNLELLYCYYNQLTNLDLSKNTALESFDSRYNEYAIKLSSKKFDLSSLPGNFQTSKASNWTNGSVSGSTLTVKDTASPVTYDYNCGNGKVVTFTLNPGASVNNIKRVEGKTPYEIAINSADLLKQIYDVNKFNNIILACGGFGDGGADDNGFADALTGSFLAAQKKAPILMHYGDASVAVNYAYITENLASGGTVYILGGPVSVPEEVEEELEDAGLKVKRLAGDNRFLTNLAILEEADVGRQEILITSGWGFADSLSVGATGLPVLVVNSITEKLIPEQIEFLEEYKNNTFTVIGGTAAISKNMKITVENVLGKELKRTYGETREETSVAIAKKYFSAPDLAVVAYSRTFPAGLCGGPLACAMKVPLLLTNGNQTPTKTTKAYLEEMNITAGYVIGSTGENALSDTVVKTVFGITSTGAIPSA